MVPVLYLQPLARGLDDRQRDIDPDTARAELGQQVVGSDGLLEEIRLQPRARAGSSQPAGHQAYVDSPHVRAPDTDRRRPENLLDDLIPVRRWGGPVAQRQHDAVFTLYELPVTRRSSGRARSSVRDPRGEERARSCHPNPVESSRISIPRSEQFTRMMWKLLNALLQPAATILRGMAADIRQRGRPAASDASSQLRHGATATTGPISRQARTSTQRNVGFQPPGTTRKLPLAPGVLSPPLLPDPPPRADKLPCHRCDAARRGSRCQAARFRADSREHGRRPAFREQERRDAR